MSSTCQDRNDKHFYITIKNQSDKDVFFCKLFTKFNGTYTKCNLNRLGVLEKNSIKEYQPFNFSIERTLGKGQVIELYLVNPNHYNEHGTFFYDCDSISIKNDILAHYRLTLEDLQQMNWTVVYPQEE
jgi:hypothetical protein